MNIGFDLDKIFIDYPPFVPDKLIDVLYKEKSDGVLRYRIPSKIEQILRLLTHYPPLRPPIWENIRFIKQFSAKKSGNELYLISSRFSFLKQRTEEIVKKYRLDKIFDGMFFNFKDEQPHIFKNKTVKKFKLDRYVDDDLPLLEFLAKENKNVSFFWLNEKEDRKLSNNLTAITSLAPVID